MSSRILVLDIAGIDTALASSSRADPDWGSTISPVLLQGQIPSGITLSTDPATGQSDAGGLSLRCRDISALLADVSTASLTTLDGVLGATATSIPLIDTSGLPASGKVWIGQEVVSYASIVSQTLTACTRAEYGTYATKHGDGDSVYASNPVILGRRVKLSWQDARAPSTSTAWIRFIGFLDSISWDDGAYTLRIISASKLATDQKVLAMPFAKGRLNRDFPGANGSLYIDHEGDTPWTFYLSTRGYAHLQVDDEIIKFANLIYPADTEPILSFTSPNKLFVSFPSKFRKGQKLDITDSAGNIQTGGTGVTVFEIFDSSLSTSYVLVSGPEIGNYSYTSGDELRANYTTFLAAQFMDRGAFGTFEAPHEAGAEATEVRVFEGNFVSQILLPLLFSVDGTGAHGPSGGAYDILPSGWGAGLDTAFVDLAALKKLDTSGRPAYRRYLWTEAVQLSDLLAWAALTLNSTVLWTELGEISGTLRDDLYPGTSTAHTIDSSRHRELTIPGLEIRTDKLYNAAEVHTDVDPVSGEPLHTLFVELVESQNRYGRRHLEISDPGLLAGPSETGLSIALTGWLYYRSLPYPEVRVAVRIEENVAYRPGQLVALTLPHLPNMKGDKGLSGTWEIVEVSPADAQGQIELRLLYRGAAPRVAHIAPSGIIAAIDVPSLTITLDTGGVTDMAPVAYSGAIPVHDDDGTEDVDWFSAGDKVTLWDVSAFGSSVSANALISSINYGTLAITLDALPGWLAVGDLLELREYAGFAGAATEADRQDIYLALADSTASPPDLGAGDTAYVWGM